ncbi:putative thiazole-containing bacteriocin maturation protein [Bacillus sp. FJAT-50079]|uniref:putative thiazole-containing bacteriocin maturation protein n=1 Tax=Bacillus sp. FJAT-50079 TaxID=2833577 RepID=UPI001BCA50BF|nr:putative thiazole-containing bacteriocin maturation protein [Bacillus sp. FJAT-50079]MBS4210605.1 putative thiazole-containing bacteriocin maturation protein [Bacillus sp. FJAT-50079]
MSKLSPSTRLKVKRDTFFLPDPKSGVYFRNNLSSFRMEGNTIYQWIEKLIPMFDGEKSLEDLTKGLTPPYQNRVYEIGETLHKNGFVRDVSRDTPHQLNRPILEKYASQIEFIENFVESGAYRFQKYREAKVLAIGSGSFLVSLASALIESGLPKINVMVTDTVPTNRQRLNEIVQNARRTELDSEIVEVSFQQEAGEEFWREAVQPYDWILYVSQSGNVNELKDLNFVCKEERKSFIPAICFQQVGLSGPLFHPESEGCWDSAWRRIHQAAFQSEERSQPFSSTTGSILANVAVFEMFKNATGIADSNQSNQIYLLDLETLEGEWLSFITHPLITSKSFTPQLVEDLDARLKKGAVRDRPPNDLLEYFSQLTSEKTGIFHTWTERSLSQLPLAQCYVQAVNPISEGPAELLPEVVCAGFTHEDAKREAGLTGIEMYATQMIDSLEFKNGNHIAGGFIGIGAGETIEEAVCRGLQVYLNEELAKRKSDQLNTIYMPLELNKDRRCKYFFNALTNLSGSPTIGLKENLLGFPVIGVRSNGRWYSSVGLNITLGMRNALEQALLDTQGQVNSILRKEMDPIVFIHKTETKLEVPSCDEVTQMQLLQSAIQTLRQNSKRLFVYDLTFEPFMKEEMAGVFGVQIREGES